MRESYLAGLTSATVVNGAPRAQGHPQCVQQRRDAVTLAPAPSAPPARAPVLRHPRAALTTWLFGIAARVASDYRRSARVRREVVTDEVPEPLDRGAAAPDAGVEQRQRRATLEAILDSLPDEQRVVFALFELDGLAADDIATLIDCPVNTVYSRLRLARAHVERSEDGSGRAVCEIIQVPATFLGMPDPSPDHPEGWYYVDARWPPPSDCPWWIAFTAGAALPPAATAHIECFEGSFDWSTDLACP